MTRLFIEQLHYASANNVKRWASISLPRQNKWRINNPRFLNNYNTVSTALIIVDLTKNDLLVDFPISFWIFNQTCLCKFGTIRFFILLFPVLRESIFTNENKQNYGEKTLHFPDKESTRSKEIKNSVFDFPTLTLGSRFRWRIAEGNEEEERMSRTRRTFFSRILDGKCIKSFSLRRAGHFSCTIFHHRTHTIYFVWMARAYLLFFSTFLFYR